MKKVLVILSISTLLMGSNVCAYGTTIEEEVSENKEVDTTVSCEIASDFEVTVPKRLSSANKQDKEFSVRGKGDIPSNKCLMVEPIDQYTSDDGDNIAKIDFILSEVTGVKGDKLVQVLQDRLLFTPEELSAEDGAEIGGTITGMDELEAGTYKGTFTYRIELVDSDISMYALPYTLTKTNYVETGIERTGDVVIPDTFKLDDGLLYKVTKIENEAFKNCTGLTSVEIPESVEVIGKQAFYGCSSLTEVTIPDSVYKIGEYAFSKCSSLQSLDIGEGVTTIEQHSFDYTSALTDVDLCNVEHLSQQAFYRSGISTIELPDTLQSIDDWAFSGCESLVSVEIPDSVTYIGVGAFLNCKNLETATVGTGLVDVPERMFHNCAKLESVQLKRDPDTIGRLAFCECIALTDLDINANVTKVGDLAFMGVPIVHANENMSDTTHGALVYGHVSDGTGTCSICGESCNKAINVSLTKDLISSWGLPNSGDIVIPSSYEVDGVQYNIVSLGNDSFRANNNITSVTISDGIQTIGKQAFYGCKYMTDIDIPESVDALGSRSLRQCIRLESLDLPDEIPILLEYTVQECSALQEVDMPTYLYRMFNNVFENCTSLKSCVLPKYIDMIDGNVFYGCTSLEEVDIFGPLGEIPSSTFYNCSSLTRCSLPSTLENISDNAFYNCTSLECLVVPDQVEYIGGNAFKGVQFVHYDGEESSSSNWGALSLGHKYTDGVCDICGTTE